MADSSQPTVDPAALRARARTALTASRHPAWRHARGQGMFAGVDAEYTIVAGPGAFALIVNGPVSYSWGFDDSGGWQVDASGMPRAMEPVELRLAQLVAAAIGGDGANAAVIGDAANVVATAEGNAKIRLDAGSDVDATLIVEHSSARPVGLTCLRPFGPEIWRFGWRAGDATLPNRIEQTLPGGLTNTVELDVAGAADEAGRRTCSPPAGRPDDCRWTTGASGALDVRRAPSGFLLVPVTIDGRDAGLFALDSGAAVSVITPTLADVLDVPAVGSAWIASGQGPQTTRRRRAGELIVGPLTLVNPWFTELDLALLSQASGVQVNGILGYDVFMRSVVDVDFEEPALTLHSADQGDGRALPWQPLSLYSNRPHLVCRFGVPGGTEASALFRLDTGAARIACSRNPRKMASLWWRSALSETRSSSDVRGGRA